VEIKEVEALLLGGLENCEIEVAGDGSHFDILVIGDVFADLRPVQKQQLVYGVLSEQIADGSIHAVNIHTYTPAEWQAKNS
jgi:acid stress-induced BolA-like protein IbaG/YrbA